MKLSTTNNIDHPTNHSSSLPHPHPQPLNHHHHHHHLSEIKPSLTPSSRLCHYSVPLPASSNPQSLSQPQPSPHPHPPPSSTHHHHHHRQSSSSQPSSSPPPATTTVTAAAPPQPPQSQPPHTSSSSHHESVFQSLPSSAVVNAAPNPNPPHASSLLGMPNNYHLRQTHAPPQPLPSHPHSHQHQHQSPPTGHTTPSTMHLPYVRQVTSVVPPPPPPPPPAPTMPSHRPAKFAHDELPVAPFRPAIQLPYNTSSRFNTPQMPSASEGYQRWGGANGGNGGGGGVGGGMPRLPRRPEAPGSMWPGWGDSEENIAGNTTPMPMAGRTRPRMNQLSETEKRARHNAHTRSSRLRIDKGLNRLKDILKKAEPGLKLNKKADVVDAAYNFVLAHLPQTTHPHPTTHPAALPHPAHHHQHDVHETSFSA